jgi:hypothetical protein
MAPVSRGMCRAASVEAEGLVANHPEAKREAALDQVRAFLNAQLARVLRELDALRNLSTSGQLPDDESARAAIVFSAAPRRPGEGVH